jgi:RNA polymerase sigma-70 factor, ECF subfamily
MSIPTDDGGGGDERDARTVTVLLRAWRAGDQAALDKLVPLIYPDLHRHASRYLRGERAEHTFQPTDLVSEAFLRLVAEEGLPEWNDRRHFVAIVARAMRRILVDHARRRKAAKRGDGARPITFDEGLFAVERPEAMIAIEEALLELAKLDERKARVIELHYFYGLTKQEVAEALDVHVNTVARDLVFAEAWIHRELRREP